MPKYLMLASSVAALLASGAAGLDESHLALKKVFHESHFKYVTYLKLNHVRSVKANLIPSCRW